MPSDGAGRTSAREKGKEGRKGREEGVERTRAAPSMTEGVGTEGRMSKAGLGHVWPAIATSSR